MSAATNYLENEVLDHVLGTGSWTMPTATYIKLHTGSPGEDATGNAATETTREEANWNAASGGTAALNATVTWTAVSTSETYSHFSVWDHISAGNPLVYGALDAPVAVTAGGTFNLTACPITLA
jgi:hypothetical protein